MKTRSKSTSGISSVHLKYRSLVRTSQIDGFLATTLGCASAVVLYVVSDIIYIYLSSFDFRSLGSPLP